MRSAAGAQPCTNNNAKLYTKSRPHRWHFDKDYGLKVQCKNGCGNTNYDAQDMTNVIGALAAAVSSSGYLNAQFTAFDRNNGMVFARCKVTFENTVADTCPEAIDGHGCGF